MSRSSRPLVVSAFIAFAAFGSFWGVWGASVPQVQDQAGVSDGRLGVALLFVGAGALPVMLGVGGVIDRWGLRFAAMAIAALGVAGSVIAFATVNFFGLCAGLALVGACSGASDVAMNAVAGRAESAAGRPVITRAHGVFSSFVVIGSLGTGLANSASLPLAAPFVAVTVLSIAAAVCMVATMPSGGRPQTTDDETPSSSWRLLPLVLIGVLGALAFASENAHQSWSAVFAHDELHARGGLSATAPAVFAATVAVTRFAIGGVRAAHARIVLLSGAACAAAGALVIAAAPNLLVASLGLALAAAGTAVLFPTLLGFVSRTVEESRRGRATSLVTTVSYLGFLLGPVYVGQWAGHAGLRTAMTSVAALAVALILLAPLVLRVVGGGTRTPGPVEDDAAVR